MYIQDLCLYLGQFTAYLSQVVRAIIYVGVGQGECVETSCRCPVRVVVYGVCVVVDGQSGRKILGLIQPDKSSMCPCPPPFLLPGYQKFTVKSLVVGLVVGGASSLLRQYPLVWPAYAAVH